MFSKVDAARALLILCLVEIVTTNRFNYVFRQIHETEFAKCEDLNYFYQMIYTLPVVEAFKLISLPLACTDCPLEAHSIRKSLISLVTSGKLDVKSIILNVRRLNGSLNKYDFLITTLMAINELPYIESSMKRQISDALFYLLKRRYLRKNSFERVREGFCESSGIRYNWKPRPQISYHVPSERQPMLDYNKLLQQQLQRGTNTQDTSYRDHMCYCQSKMIELLLSKLFALMNHRKMILNCVSQPNVISRNPIVKPQQGRILHNVVPRPRLPFYNSLDSIVRQQQFQRLQEQLQQQQQRQQQERRLYVVPKVTSRPTVPSYHYTTVVPDYNLKHVTLEYPSGPILSTVSPTFTRTAPIVPTIPVAPMIENKQIILENKMKENEAQKMKVQNLINLIPAPKYPKEEEMYGKLKQLLSSPQVMDIVQNLNLTSYTNEKEMLDVIITTVLKTVTTEEIHEVFSFYSTYKEVEKSHFNYGVLVDALPQPKSPKEQAYYMVLKQLLTNKQIYDLIMSTSFTENMNMSEKLEVVLKQLVESGTVTSDITEAARYYTPVVTGRRANIHPENLITLIPAPTTEQETTWYNMLKTILESNDIYILMQNVNLNNLTNIQRLMLILRELIMSNTELAEAAIYYRNVLIAQKYGFSYFDLLKLIPMTEENRSYFAVITNYFYTAEFESILIQLTLAELSDSEKLLMILEAIETHSTDTRVVEAAKYLLGKLRLTLYYENMQKVIAMIPLPNTETETVKYDIVKNFLLSEQAYTLLSTLDFTIFPHDKHLLEFILKTVVENSADGTIKDACEYYIDLSERLQSIEFVTKKVIKKNFKLTEIFTDTLELKTLTLSQKDAFRKFFKYISQMNPDAMSKFDSWDQAKTRGEFMKLLFKYLLEQPDTLPEIKESIMVLTSLVKMDGKGALPP